MREQCLLLKHLENAGVKLSSQVPEESIELEFRDAKDCSFQYMEQ